MARLVLTASGGLRTGLAPPSQSDLRQVGPAHCFQDQVAEWHVLLVGRTLRESIRTLDPVLEDFSIALIARL